MIEMILGFIFMVLVLLAMSIGVIMGRQPIKGSCGGVGAALGESDYTCEICGGDPNKCESSESDNANPVAGSSLGYNVSPRD